MAQEAPHLRVVGPGERPQPRRPGPAVLSILLYALVFGGALWFLRSKGLVSRKSVGSGPVRAAATGPGSSSSARRGEGGTGRRGEIPPSRDALLSGEAVPESAHNEYFHHLATDRCDCGCGRTLSDCLANERSCARSAALAGALRETGNGKRETVNGKR